MAVERDTSAVVLVLDRLGAGYLGPYGNTWIDTPAMNRLASQSILIEHPLIDSPVLETLYRSYWRGTHAACPDADNAPPDLAGRLRRSGVATALLTDAPRIAGHVLAAGFEEQIVVEPERRLDSAANVEQTHLARLLARAVQWLSEAAPPFLLWIHARAMSGPWDAPLDLRRQLADEDDPDPPEFVAVPNQYRASDYDPDELFGIALAYAGQVLALDQCLGALTDTLEFLSPSEKTLFFLTSSRGFPLGEHRRIGCEDAPLYHELLHVPCILRMSDQLGANLRSQSLWQPHQLYRILVDWFACGDETTAPETANLLRLADGECGTMLQRACTILPCESALRTPAWFLRAPRRAGENAHGPTEPDVDDDQVHELFVKPDDRWDANNVASRCPTVVRQMHEQLILFQRMAKQGRLDQMPPLPDDLIEFWE